MRRAITATTVVMGMMLTAVGLAAPAQAAAGTVTNISVSIEQDGTAPFTTGFDSGPNDGVVATADAITYAVSASYAQVGDATFTAVLPDGMRWDASATAATVCNGPAGGSISADRRTLTCERTAQGLAETMSIKALTYGVASGADVAVAVSSGAVRATSPAVTVKGAPRYEVAVMAMRGTPNYTHNGQLGQLLVTYVGAKTPKVSTAARDMRGVEALRPSTMTVDVPAGATLVSTTRFTSSSQTGGAGNPITLGVPAMGAPTAGDTFNDSTVHPSWYYWSASSYGLVEIFVPYDPYIPVNQTVDLPFTLKWDMKSLSGASGTSTNFVNGFAPTANCSARATRITGAAAFPTTGCFTYVFNRVNKAELIPMVTGLSLAPSAMMPGDDSFYMSNSRRESATRGTTVSANFGIGNMLGASDPVIGGHGCVAWDNSRLTLSGVATLGAHTITVGSRDAVGARPAVQSGIAGETIEYAALSFANDDARRTAACGEPGDGNIAWSSTPAGVAGGAAAVTAIRYSAPDLEETDAVRLNAAFIVSAPATGEVIEAFHSYGSADGWHSSRYPSDGFVLRAGDGVALRVIDGMIRHRTVATPATSEPGDLINYEIRPTALGALVPGVDSVIADVTYTVSLDSPCLTPVATALGSLGVPATYTPADPGADGILCTADDGAPGSIRVGPYDVTAPGIVPGTGSSSDFGPRNGTALPALVIPMQTSVLTPRATTSVITSVVAATGDTTEALSPTTGDPRTLDRTETASLVINGVASFQGDMTASTRIAGAVAPGEQYSYTLSWGNGTSDDAGVGTFVDVLPFEGDPRGTHGLGGAPLRVIGVQSATQNPAVMGGVNVEWTTDAGASVLAAVNVTGNQAATTGVAWRSGTVPSDGSVTALRFRTAASIKPGYSGTATMTVVADRLARGGALHNDMYGATALPSSDPHLFRAAAPVRLISSAATVSGTAWRDVDFSSTVTASDVAWPTGASVRLTEASDPTRFVQTTIGSGGEFTFAPVAPGEYVLAVTDLAGTKRLLPQALINVPAGGDLSDVDLLMQEVLDAPRLASDTATVAQGNAVSVDVADNDTIDLPTAVHSSVSLAGIAAPVAAPAHGSVTLVAGGSQSQPRVRYQAATAWPAAYATENEYVDTFSYAYTSLTGQSATAQVSVTVTRTADAVDDVATIPDAATAVDVLKNDHGAGITLTDAVVDSGDASVTFTATGLTVTPTHTWAGAELSHAVTVNYTITDRNARTSSATATVTIQRAPLVSDGAETVIVDAPATFDSAPATAGTITRAVGAGQHAGRVRAAVDGAVTFDTVGLVPGQYSFGVIITDDLAQSSTAAFTVTVVGKPVATGGSRTVPVDGAATFTGTITGPVAIVTATASGPTAGAVTAGIDGVVAFDAAGLPVGEHTFTVTYADSLGQKASADFTVTVQAGPGATGGSVTIAQDATATFDAAPVTTAAIASAKASGAQAARVNAGVNGVITFDAEGLDPADGPFAFSVTFVDDLGQSVKADYSVAVQAPPRVGGGKDTIPEGGVASFNAAASALTGGSIVSVSVSGAGASAVTADRTGAVTFDGAIVTPGVYAFAVTYTDDLGQPGTASFAVTVQAAPTGEGRTFTVVSDRDTVSFDPRDDVSGTNVADVAAEDVSAPEHGTVWVGNDGAITYTPEVGTYGEFSFTVTFTDDLDQTVTLTYAVIVPAPPVVPEEDTPIPPIGVSPDDLLAATGAVAPYLGLWMVVGLLLSGAVLMVSTRRAKGRTRSS